MTPRSSPIHPQISSMPVPVQLASSANSGDRHRCIIAPFIVRTPHPAHWDGLILIV